MAVDCLDASLNVGGPGGTAGEGRLKGVSQAREAPVDDGVLYDCHKQSIQIQLEGHLEDNTQTLTHR